MKRRGLAQYSDLIGSIYDCAIDPALWPDAIAGICEATDCMAGLIAVNDLERSELRLMQTWNFDAEALSGMAAYADEVAALWAAALPVLPGPVDEPASSWRTLPREVFNGSRYYNEWGRPRGIVDSLHLLLLRQPTRIAEFSLSRHESFGLITDENLDTARLLAPHIRRAITISDLLDMKNLKAQALGATLDTVAVGVVVVGAEGRILHANDVAQCMLDSRSPIVSLQGCLTALHPDITRELLTAVALAQSNEAGIGVTGIGVPLLHRNSAPATAHVLPLARGDLRTRLVPQATAAVFIAPSGTPLPGDLDTVARIFGLTPAETKVLRRLAAGDSIEEASAALQVSASTTRTHSQRLYSKMGVSRRSELIALLNRLVPPVGRPGADRGRRN